MKALVCLFVLSIIQAALARDNFVACSFPSKSESMIIGNCARLRSGKNLEIEKSVLKKVIFDKNGLAGGTISQFGCY